MKTFYYSILGLLLLFVSCDNETESVFDKPAEVRASEAISTLKSDLIAPSNGWRVKYQPEDGSGAYWILLHFFEDNKLVIESDLGARDGEFFMDTLTYRIDNSLGLELIFETYSVFSYLFEQDNASFLAEYEFNYASKASDGSLVFESKTDPSDKTTLLFEQAGADDIQLLGQEVSDNLNTLSEDIRGLLFSAPNYALTYLNQDLVFYFALDDVRRTINITSAAKKSTTTGAQTVNFSTGYYLQGDSLILHDTFSGTYQGIAVSLNSFLFTKLSTTTIDLCGGAEVHQYEAISSQSDNVYMQATLSSPAGANFANFNFLVSPIDYIYDNGENAASAIASDITGAVAMQLYYNFDGFYALGFLIQNADGTNTFALREFTPVLSGNNIVFQFAPDLSIFGNPDTPANLDNVNIYLDALTKDGQTYMFEAQEDVYEMNNPCTGWTAAFIGIQ